VERRCLWLLVGKTGKGPKRGAAVWPGERGGGPVKRSAKREFSEPGKQRGFKGVPRPSLVAPPRGGGKKKRGVFLPRGKKKSLFCPVVRNVLGKDPPTWWEEGRGSWKGFSEGG